MKKQILFMMFLSLAFLFAGVKSYGQDEDIKTLDFNYLDVPDGSSIDCVPANPLDCVDGAGPLNPVPGMVYTYAITDDEGRELSNITGVQWFVWNATATDADVNPGNGPALITDGVLVDDDDFEPIGTGNFLLTAEGHYGEMTPVPADYDFDDDPTTPFTIDISWQYFDGNTNEILLVAFVEGDCANNIEVYRIKPAFSFTLDIASLMPDGTLNYQLDGDGNPTETIIPAVECVSPVWSATYTPGTPELTVDYGGNYVFFVVNAANFVNSWQPTFEATVDDVAAAAGTTVTEIAWAYRADLNDPTVTATWNYADLDNTDPDLVGLADPVLIQELDEDDVRIEAVDADGECIIVRVLVEHNENETLAETTVTLGVNGIMYDQENAASRYTNSDLRDVDEPETAGGDCRQDYTDSADYVLTPRPEVVTNTEPGEDAGDQDPFEPKNP